MSTRTILTRTGAAPLQFEGTLLAEAHSQQRSGPAENRWFELAIYQLAGSDSMVGAIGFRSRWQGEHDHDCARKLLSPAEAVEFFSGYDPCATDLWQGYPSNVGDSGQRNERQWSAIRNAYLAAVTELLNHERFAETI